MARLLQISNMPPSPNLTLRPHNSFLFRHGTPCECFEEAETTYANKTKAPLLKKKKKCINGVGYLGRKFVGLVLESSFTRLRRLHPGDQSGTEARQLFQGRSSSLACEGEAWIGSSPPGCKS